jgi:hypothetical protein
MKSTRWWVGTVVVCGSLFVSHAYAQPPVPKPGPEIDHLKAMVGFWNATVKMGGAESKGHMNYSMGLGGLWLESQFEGDFGGMKFSGHGFDSYDQAKKKYVSVWVDSMETSPMLMEGDFDKDSNSMTMVGEGPGQDGKPAKYKSVSEMKDKNHMVFKLYSVDKDGKDQEVMEIDYQRIAGAGPRRIK